MAWTEVDLSTAVLLESCVYTGSVIEQTDVGTPMTSMFCIPELRLVAGQTLVIEVDCPLLFNGIYPQSLAGPDDGASFDEYLLSNWYLIFNLDDDQSAMANPTFTVGPGYADFDTALEVPETYIIWWFSDDSDAQVTGMRYEYFGEADPIPTATTLASRAVFAS